MNTLKLKDDLFWNGILDPDLRVFDIVMETEFGTTYNSYILKGSEKTALIETAKAKFSDQYIASVEEIVPIKEVDYIIVNHTEPDHAGSVEKILSMNPNVKIVGSPVAVGYLKNIVNRDFDSIPVKEKDTLSLGDKTLTFMSVPNLHWPDTMYTYWEEGKVLFTCDSFGAHYSHKGILRSTVTDTKGYMQAAKYYFDNIIGPFKQPFMTNALKRIEGLDIQIICPGHGPVLDSGIEELMAIYREWCRVDKPSDKKTVIIPYVSAYGYTAQLAHCMKEGIEESGDIKVLLYDMVEASMDAVMEEIAYADGLLLGTPTIVGEALKPIWDITTNMFAPVHKGKLAAAFGSYGWSGEGVPHITERLKQLKLKVLEGFRVRFKPSEEDLKEAKAYGCHFGCVLLGKEEME